MNDLFTIDEPTAVWELGPGYEFLDVAGVARRTIERDGETVLCRHTVFDRPTVLDGVVLTTGYSKSNPNGLHKVASDIFPMRVTKGPTVRVGATLGAVAVFTLPTGSVVLDATGDARQLRKFDGVLELATVRRQHEIPAHEWRRCQPEAPFTLVYVPGDEATSVNDGTSSNASAPDLFCVNVLDKDGELSVMEVDRIGSYIGDGAPIIRFERGGRVVRFLNMDCFADVWEA